MSDLAALYRHGRLRIGEVARGGDERAAVPACPDWTAHDLVAHLSGIAERLTSGDYPARDDAQPWIDDIRREALDLPLDVVLARWAACGEATEGLIEAGNWQLPVDLLVHEQDLRGALGGPVRREGEETPVLLELLLRLHARAIAQAGLGPLAVRDGTASWASGPGDAGCTLAAPLWEATRILAARRTADEIRSAVVAGDVEPYLELLDRHGPLPRTSLGEVP
ncbi:MAG TPA: maleylpyruvate isomerase family mycothiol-dependent enzyme [Acidimicrobiales bacterium]|nr:maleylpyruvate isomerase family mycothiol-dependent enzyme [Acidimicrobiales bacterium]